MPYIHASGMENILFIINPLSEKRKGIDLERLVNTHLDFSRFSCTLKYTEYPGHACTLAKDHLKEFDTIVAAGGDGTVNQVSQALIGSGKYLGLIPLGSGNGLARTLKIPQKASEAIKRLNRQRTLLIDTGEINGKHFVNVAGIGFDAHVARDFAKSKRRGFISYVSSALRLFKAYGDEHYTIIQEGVEQERKAFLISFANSTQYGNNAHISPGAKVDDGLIDLCILRKFPLRMAPVLAGRLFFKTLHKSRYIEIRQFESVRVKSNSENPGHIDGEPVLLENELHVRIRKKSLNVIV